MFDAETIYNQWTFFPEDFDAFAAKLTFVESPPGTLTRTTSWM